MRLLRAFALVAVLAGVFASSAAAGGYTDASYFTPVGKVGQPYSHTVEWKPGTGCPPYTYAVVGGAFPPGLTLSSSGHITGTPTQAGTYTFYIRQTDNCGPEGEGNAPFVIKIEGGAPPLAVTSNTLSNGEAELSYSVALTSSGGGGTSRTWSVTSGQLPPGLTLSSDGSLSGTPTTAGTYTFTATVSDGTSSSSKSLTVTIIPGITVNAAPVVPLAEVRTPYSVSVPTLLGVTGGMPPYRYAPVSGFPFGIGFDSATGEIFGSPREAGVVALTIQITDSNNATKQVTLSVTVLPKLQILRLRLTGGRVGNSYRTNVTVTGGKGPVWTMPSGKLPTGLKLNSATGVISGKPKRAGSFRFSVSVKDSLGATVSIRYVLLIRK
ncbi:MAG: putative Ig domain-containing protein [Gaiellaceae bacterium]